MQSGRFVLNSKKLLQSGGMAICKLYMVVSSYNTVEFISGLDGVKYIGTRRIH